MNKSKFSKNIHYEAELYHEFANLLSIDPDLKWRNLSLDHQAEAGADGSIELELDDLSIRFAVEFQLKPNLPALKKRLRQAKDPLLLVVPRLSQRLLDQCKALRLSVIDLNGRMWLRSHGIRVERSPLPGRSFAYELEPRNIFVGKSERIIRTLLSDVGRIWTQADVSKRVDASSGLVSRIFQHLVSLDYLEKPSPREYHLIKAEALLDAWTKEDHFNERTETYAYAGFLGDPVDLAKRIEQWAKDTKARLAFTQWFAAWLRSPYTQPVVVSAYVERLPSPADLESLGLRPVKEGGKLWLHIPKDNGVFETTQTVKEYTIVSDAQVFLDLQNAGLRGDEAAQALRESPTFCNPLQ